MPGPITYAAVALLTRDRLRRIRSSLRAKIENRPTATDLERQLAYLADRALVAMDASQPTVQPPVRLYGPAQGDQVSKFLFLGAVGPEFTAFSAQYAPLQRWLRDTLHKGTPDQHHEQALAYSSDFVLEFWRRVLPAAGANGASAAARDETLARMRSVVLGHCCHIATDVISSPYVDALEARLGVPGRPKLSADQVISAIEAEVLNLMFAPSAPATGHEVDSWWPEPALVPSVFYTAFREALEATYGAGAQREGGAPYEAMRAEHAPPLLSAALLEDGYRSFRMALGMGHSWSLPQWMGFTACMYVPAFVALPVAAALPNARNQFRSSPPAGHDPAAGLFESFMLPFALGSVVPLSYTLGLHLSPLGAEGPVIFSWVSSAVQLVAGVVFFATLGTGGFEAKWPLLFALPLALEIASLVYTLTQVNADNPRRWLLALAALSHLGLGLVFVLLFWAFLHQGPQALNDGDGAAFAGWLLLWFLILGALWMGTALLMRYVAAPVPQRPAGTLGSGLVALPGGSSANQLVGPSAVQLIDENALSFAGPVDDTTSPAARYFPTDRRPLLKLWWPGGGAPTVLARYDRLVFSFGATTRTFFAPAAPMLLVDLAAQLKAVVTNAAGQPGLEAKLFFAEQASAEEALLPPGLLFADHGDEHGTLAEHNTQAALAKPLGDSEGSAYVLQAAPRRAKAVLFERDGPQGGDLRDPAVLVAGQGVLAVDAGDARFLSIPVGSATRFIEFMLAGDVIEADLSAGGNARRVVAVVESDTRLLLVTPLPGAISGVWRRVVRPVTGVEATPAGWQLQSVSSNLFHNLLQASAGAPQLGAFFKPGDEIELQPVGGPNQRRIVNEVLNDTMLTINRRLDAPLQAAAPANPPPPAAPSVAFGRVAAADANLYTYLASPDDTLFSGQALMNEAADLGALLCMGAMSHLLSDSERDKSKFGAQSSLNKSYQVFRNWNLDRRRVNEWRMLVQGAAVDEKGGAPDGADFAMGAVPSGWRSLAPDGDATARQLGWLPLLRGWLEMSELPGNDAADVAPFRPGMPGNAALGRALAFVLDQTPPAAPAAP